MSSWIREHFRTFVWPALDAVSSGAGQTFLPEKARPPNWFSEIRCQQRTEATNFPHSELHQLQIYYRHFRIPQPGPFAGFLQRWCPSQWGGTVVHNAPWEIEEIWGRVRRSFDSAASYAKQRERTLLLAGRDVWVFKILAERHKIPVIYIPEISRSVAGHKKALLDLLAKHGVDGSELLVDTGFMGSIPKAISQATGKNIEFMLLSQNPVGQIPRRVTRDTITAVPQQIFPNMKGSRSFALWMEYLPKSFESGRVSYDPDRVVQPLSSESEIIAAACLTSCVWHGIPDWALMLSKITSPPPGYQHQNPIRRYLCALSLL